MSQAVSVGAGGVSLARRSNAGGTGSTEVTVHGSGFGLTSWSSSGRAGQTGCESTLWTGETGLVCKAGQLARSTRRVSVSVGLNVGSVTEAISAGAASLSVVQRGNQATTGFMSITVFGARAGLALHSAALSTGGTQSEGTLWISDTAVLLRSSGGRGRSRHVSMTVVRSGGSMSRAVSSDVPFLGIFHGSANIAFTGSASIAVNGAEVGLMVYSVGMRVGLTSCESTEWLSDTFVRCRLGAGFARSTRLSTSAGMALGSASESLSFVLGALSVTLPANVASTGSISVTIQGAGLGNVQITGNARVGHSSCEASAWLSSTSLKCRAMHGDKVTRRTSVSAAQSVSSSSEVISLDLTELSSSMSSNVCVSGSASVTIQGKNVGASRSCAMASISASSCESSRWVSDSALSCQAGAGLRQKLGVGHA